MQNPFRTPDRYSPRSVFRAFSTLRALVSAAFAFATGNVSCCFLLFDSASNADVKRFAQRMLTDHQAMNEQGHQLAQQLNVPSQPGSATQTVGQQSEEIGQQLHGKKGKEFDVAFMDAMVRSHESTLQLLDQSANTTNTPQLDQHIAQARTKVQSHLDEAKQIQQKLGTS